MDQNSFEIRILAYPSRRRRALVRWLPVVGVLMMTVVFALTALSV